MRDKKEKRRLQRFDLCLPARIYPAKKEGANEAIVAPTINICAGGVLLDSDTGLETGSKVELEIVLNLDELEKLQEKKAQIKLSGVVLRSDATGTAVAFDENYELEPIG